MDKEQNKEKKPVTEQLNEGRRKVDSAVSFIDWIRHIINWLKGFIGR